MSAQRVADVRSSFAQQVNDLDAFLLLGNDEGEVRPSAPAPFAAEPPPSQQLTALSEKMPKSILDLEPLREQDRLLPIANLAHLMANELPTGAKVSKDTKCLMQEVLSEFIGFITSEANDVCLHGKQKAITQSDIMTALRNMGETSKLPPSTATPLTTSLALLPPTSRDRRRNHFAFCTARRSQTLDNSFHQSRQQ